MGKTTEALPLGFFGAGGGINCGADGDPPLDNGDGPPDSSFAGRWRLGEPVGVESTAVLADPLALGLLRAPCVPFARVTARRFAGGTVNARVQRVAQRVTQSKRVAHATTTCTCHIFMLVVGTRVTYGIITTMVTCGLNDPGCSYLV